LLGLVFVLTSFWIASYSAASGVAIVRLINSFEGPVLSIQEVPKWIGLGVGLGCLVLLLIAKRTYQVVKGTLDVVAVLSVALISMISVMTVVSKGRLAEFLGYVLVPRFSLPSDWSQADAKVVVTAIVFAGVGGLWNVLYAQWVRDERLGMASLVASEHLDYQSQWPEIEAGEKSVLNYRRNMARLRRDLVVGVGLNCIMLLMLAYIAFAWHSPGDQAPSGLAIITTLAEAVSNSGEVWGRLFLVLIALFLIDTWLAAGDSLAKIYGALLCSLSGRVVASPTVLYRSMLVMVGGLTVLSTFAAAPHQVIFFNGVVSGCASVLLIAGLWVIERKLISGYPWLPRDKPILIGLGFAMLVYSALAVFYFAE